MSTNNYQIVKELDTRYAIALGFCADGDPDDVYDNVEDARAQNERRTPSVGFVVIDRQTGEWADFAMQAFAYYEGALQCYNEHMEQPDVVPALLLIPLDENVALTLYHEDLSSELCPNGYTFTFCDSKTRKALVNEPSFPTCDEALAYYEKHLKAGESEDDTQVITDFSGEYGFLNNGYAQIDHPIHIFGRDFYTAEGAFQSQKCPEQADSFRDATGRSAKALGKHVPLRSDWDSIKDLVMAEVLLAKFSQNDILRQKLLSTGDVRIEPHNTRHDNYWGNCQCAECAWKKKENRLGTILMRIRESSDERKGKSMIKMYENLKSVRIPTGEEWNAFMDVTDENNNIANWKDMLSWTLSAGELVNRAARGHYSPRSWCCYAADDRSLYVGFRPAFELLNPDSLENGQRVIAGTLYMNGEPVPVPKNPVYKGDILNYIPGATLEMREALDDPDFQVQAIKAGDVLVCDRNLLRMISSIDIENQDFCSNT